MAEAPDGQQFACNVCGLTAPYEVFGTSLPSHNVDILQAKDERAGTNIVFLEPVFLVSDPSAGKRRPLAIGAECSLCRARVCMAETCSFFYAKRFCATCAIGHKIAFPPQCWKVAPGIFSTASKKT